MLREIYSQVSTMVGNAENWNTYVSRGCSEKERVRDRRRERGIERETEWGERERQGDF